MPKSSAARWYWIAIAAGVLDQLSKLMVVRSMDYGDSIPLARFFNLVHVRNEGAAFSFLADAGGWQRYFLIAVSLAISAALATLLWRRPPFWEALGFSLVLGGAIGNVVDRLNRGFVVDFLDFHWAGWHWPAFNLADVCIISGVAVLLLASLLSGQGGEPGTGGSR